MAEIKFEIIDKIAAKTYLENYGIEPFIDITEEVCYTAFPKDCPLETY